MHSHFTLFDKEKDSELMLEVAFRTFDEYKDAKKQLVTKTSIILASNGILFGFIANIIVAGKADNSTPVIFSLFITAIGLSVSMGCCIAVLQNREFDDFKLDEFLEKIEMKPCNEEGLPFEVYDRIRSYIESYVNNLEEMGEYYEWGLYALFFSIITSLISTALLFV